MAELCDNCGHQLPNAVGAGLYCTNCGEPVHKTESNRFKSNVITLPEQTERIDLAEYVSDFCRMAQENEDDTPTKQEVASCYIGATYGMELTDEEFRNLMKHWTPQVEYYLP